MDKGVTEIEGATVACPLVVIQLTVFVPAKPVDADEQG